MGWVFSGRHRLLGGVFTRQVAHLAHRRRPGVDKGAELANPLWQRARRVRSKDDAAERGSEAAHKPVCACLQTEI